MSGSFRREIRREIDSLTMLNPQERGFQIHQMPSAWEESQSRQVPVAACCSELPRNCRNCQYGDGYEGSCRLLQH